jgi:hypothetical protein
MASEVVSEFITSTGWGGPRSASLFDAFSRRARVFDEPLFDNLSAYAIGLAIFVGAWFAGWFVQQLILYALGVNWKRIFPCCTRRKEHGQDNDDPFFKNPNDPNVSVNKPKILPVRGKFTRTGDVVGVVPQQYKEVPVEQVHHDSRLFSGVKPSRLDNYVRLAAFVSRSIVLVGGLMLAFQAAGVNVLSLAASMGIVTLCFTYGGASLLRNFLSIMYILGTNKLSIGMYIRIGDKQGVITAFCSQWTEITDDLSPSQGRQIHFIANGSLMDGDLTMYPDGPPSSVVLRYFKDIKAVNEERVAQGLPSLEPINALLLSHFG